MIAHKGHKHTCDANSIASLTIAQDHVEAQIAGTIRGEGGQGIVVGEAGVVAQDAILGVDVNVERYPIGGSPVDEDVGQVEEESGPLPILAPLGKVAELDETNSQGDGFVGRRHIEEGEGAGDGKGLGEDHRANKNREKVST